MVSGLNFQPQNCYFAPKAQYAHSARHSGVISNAYVQNISYVTSFKGASGIRSFAIRLLEKTKSKISHNVVLISGPSGVGKDTIIKGAMEKLPNSQKALSHTTRKMREGEVSGQDYYFISQAEFDEMKKRGEFAFGTDYVGQSYGGKSAEIKAKRKGGVVFLNTSSFVAHRIKELYGKNAVLIFIKPPSELAIKERLLQRGTEKAAEVEKRLSSGREQINFIHEYDKVVINDNLENAVNAVVDYIKSRRSFMVRTVDNLIDFLKKKN